MATWHLSESSSSLWSQGSREIMHGQTTAMERVHMVDAMSNLRLEMLKINAGERLFLGHALKG